MQIDQKLLTELNNYQVENGERLLWIALRLEEPEPDGFFLLSVKEWSEKYNLPESSLKRYLKTLEEKGLIRRDYRPLTADTPYPVGGSGGKFLFVQVFEPQAENNMTFFGKLHLIETKTLSPKEEHKTAIFRDVYNLADTIRFKYAFCDLEKNDANSQDLKNMEIGQNVVFKGHVKRNTEGRPWIVDIWNIRSIEKFYANRRN